MAKRTCIDCSTDISGRHHNAKRCKPCADAQGKALSGIGTRIRPCAINDAECVQGRLKRGFCEMHYRRLRLTGSTERHAVDYLQQYEVDVNGCWLWSGPLYWNGYGSISQATYGTGLAHRASYEHHVGPIPPGLDLDHLCRVRRCINPEHLEPVTHSVNIQRGFDARLGNDCQRGHDQTLPDARWIEPSTGRSFCRKCKALREKAGRERRKREVI